jgi:hypothetical protein
MPPSIVGDEAPSMTPDKPVPDRALGAVLHIGASFGNEFNELRFGKRIKYASPMGQVLINPSVGQGGRRWPVFLQPASKPVTGIQSNRVALHRYHLPETPLGSQPYLGCISFEVFVLGLLGVELHGHALVADILDLVHGFCVSERAAMPRQIE